MQCRCAGGFCSIPICIRFSTADDLAYWLLFGILGWEDYLFCAVSCLFVWNLLGGPHESGYIYLLPQSSPLAQCSTATTCTIQTRLCSVPLWTEDLWGALWHVNLLFFFPLARAGIEPCTFSVNWWKAGALPLSYPTTGRHTLKFHITVYDYRVPFGWAHAVFSAKNTKRSQYARTEADRYRMQV